MSQEIFVELYPHFALSIILASTPHFLFWLLPLDSAHFPSLAVMESVAAQNVRMNSSHCLITQLSCGHCLEKEQAHSKTPENFCRTLSLAADLWLYECVCRTNSIECFKKTYLLISSGTIWHMWPTMCWFWLHVQLWPLSLGPWPKPTLVLRIRLSLIAIGVLHL